MKMKASQRRTSRGTPVLFWESESPLKKHSHIFINHSLFIRLEADLKDSLAQYQSLLRNRSISDRAKDLINRFKRVKVAQGMIEDTARKEAKETMEQFHVCFSPTTFHLLKQSNFAARLPGSQKQLPGCQSGRRTPRTQHQMPRLI